MPKKGNIPWNKNKKGLQIVWNKGLTKETDESMMQISIKMSKIKKGKPLSEEHKRKIGEANRGVDHPFYGKHHTEEAKKKISKAKKGKHYSEEIREKMRIIHRGERNGFYGKHHTEESKEKNRLAHLGKHFSPATEFKKGIVPWIKGKKGYWHHTEEAKKKISEASRKQEHTKEQIRNCLRRRIPSSLEAKFQSIIDKYKLPYKYVGNGAFFIEKCNPDFVNVDGEKIAIEVYARFYKELGNRDVDSWKEHRTEIFQKYGWDLIFFDEHEVNDNYVLARLKEEKNEASMS